MNLRLANINGVLYITDLNNPDFKYAVVNMVKINEGAFLLGENENKLNNFDVTTIEKFSNGFRKATKAENLLMSYITDTLQQKINNGELQTIDDLKVAVADINQYVNSNQELLDDIRELEGKDNIVVARKDDIVDHIAEKMSGNKYFKNQIIEQSPVLQPTEAIENNEIEQSISSISVQPVETIIPEDQLTNAAETVQQGENNNIVSSIIQELQETHQNNSITEEKIEEQPQSLQSNQTVLTPYDEETVTMILSMPQAITFDINAVISQYFNDLTIEQIDLLLNNFQLNELQRKTLMERKNNMITATENMNIENTIIQEPAKVKTLSLMGKKDREKAAFVDTLLLSFTVGTFCGIYLMYFILTIMS